MAVEEDSVVSGTSSVTRNFVGARGIESIFTTTTSGTTTAFPLYDCHGNMVATVARSGAGFVTSNVRTYDVWGGIRTGANTGGPKGRYVANLGHVQDDESGLIYMRARYYEPESGRFISEDPAMDGANWFAYANNEPVNNIDKNGREYSRQELSQAWFFLGCVAFAGALKLAYEVNFSKINPAVRKIYAAMGAAFLLASASAFSESLGYSGKSESELLSTGKVLAWASSLAMAIFESMDLPAKRTFAGIAVAMNALYMVQVLGALLQPELVGE